MILITAGLAGRVNDDGTIRSVCAEVRRLHADFLRHVRVHECDGAAIAAGIVDIHAVKKLA